MNRHLKYLAIGLVCAIAILAVITAASLITYGNRKKERVLQREDAGFAKETVTADRSSEVRGEKTEAASGRQDAEADDNLNRFLHRQDVITEEMKESMESIPKTGNASIDFLNSMGLQLEAQAAMSEDYLNCNGRDKRLKAFAEDVIERRQEETGLLRELKEKYEAEGHKDEDKENAFLDEYDKLLRRSPEMEKPGTDSLEHAFAEGLLLHRRITGELAGFILEYTDYEEIRSYAKNRIRTQKEEEELLKEFLPKK